MEPDPVLAGLPLAEVHLVEFRHDDRLDGEAGRERRCRLRGSPQAGDEERRGGIGRQAPGNRLRLLDALGRERGVATALRVLREQAPGKCRR